MAQVEFTVKPLACMGSNSEYMGLLQKGWELDMQKFDSLEMCSMGWEADLL